MASASVPDPSIGKPLRIGRGMNKGEKRDLAVGGVFAVTIILFYAIGVNTYINNLTHEQFNVASPLIIQLDSFLTAGWIVGFFYYWGNWEKAFRKFQSARKALKSNEPSRQYNTPLQALFDQAMAAKQNEMAPTSKIFIAVVLGVVSFIISGLAAVFAVLTYAVWNIQWSLDMLAGGVDIMVLSWVFLRSTTQKVKDFTDVALELSR